MYARYMRTLAWFVGAALFGSSVACSGDNNGKTSPNEGTTGGTADVGSGGTADVGSGGTQAASGGSKSSAGGASAGTGGASAGTGGASAGAGGASAGTGGAASTAPGPVYGQVYDGGQYNLGPVDYSESQWHNACAPQTKYPAAVQAAEGDLLAGLWNGIPNTANYCDACILVKTGKGKSAVLRVVTYGDTSTNSIDVSQTAYDILNTGEYPRPMTWQFTECPQAGNLIYTFQTGSNAYWTSLWIRNARVPLTKVEVKSANHASFIELVRNTDGTLNDASGFGQGPFTFRLTGMDGKQYTEDFAWPATGVTGTTLTGKGNID